MKKEIKPFSRNKRLTAARFNASLNVKLLQTCCCVAIPASMSQPRTTSTDEW